MTQLYIDGIEAVLPADFSIAVKRENPLFTKNGEYTYIINTTSGRRAIEDSRVIRRSALQYKVHYDTTLNGGFATAMALNADATEKVISVQEMHAQIK